jgi:hypothetical protein
MNWKLTQPSPDDDPQVDDWSCLTEPKSPGPRLDILKIMFSGYEKEGVEELAPGVWRVPGGWV